MSLSKCQENDYIQTAKKVSKINLRIISKPHAHLQSMVKTHKVHTPTGGQKDGRTKGRTYRRTDIWNDGKPKLLSPSAFLQKALDNYKVVISW